MSLRTWIKSHEMLYFWSRIFQGCRQTDYRQRVLDITDHPAMARVEQLGEQYPDRLFYLIDLDDTGNHSGFFGLLTDTVKRLELARRLGAEPYIRWSNTSYAGTDKNISSSANDFVQFFEEPCDFSYEDIRKAQNVVISRVTDGFHRDDSQVYLEKDGFLAQIAQLYVRYIRLQPAIREMISKDQQKLTDSFDHIIGIHVRGADYRVGLKGHPQAVSCEEYAQVIDQLDDSYRIFLATDDTRVLEYFSKRYGDRILSYDDTFRSTQDLGVHYTKDDRQDHGYRLGYEVLRDVDTLSRCCNLIAGVSYVSFTARVWKEAREEKYQVMRILDHGVNRSGITSEEFNRAYNANA